MTNPLPDWAMEKARDLAKPFLSWAELETRAQRFILSAYQQGKQDGQREMKERAAKVADAIGQRAKTIDGQRTGLAIASAIRRLDEVQDDA